MTELKIRRMDDMVELVECKNVLSENEIREILGRTKETIYRRGVYYYRGSDFVKVYGHQNDWWHLAPGYVYQTDEFYKLTKVMREAGNRFHELKKNEPPIETVLI